MLTKRDIPAIDVEVVHSTTAFVEKIDIDGVAASDSGRAEFMFETIERFGVGVSGDFRDLAMEVGLRTPFEEGLSHYLNQLEPVTKDLALLTEGVAIMSMQRSKGLRFRGAVVMGVENGVIPSPRAVDSEKERRLLYVAMTRAKEYVFLTMATWRTGPHCKNGRSERGAVQESVPFLLRHEHRSRWRQGVHQSPRTGAGT